MFIRSLRNFIYPLTLIQHTFIMCKIHSLNSSTPKTRHLPGPWLGVSMVSYWNEILSECLLIYSVYKLYTTLLSIKFLELTNFEEFPSFECLSHTSYSNDKLVENRKKIGLKWTNIHRFWKDTVSQQDERIMKVLV